MHNRVLGLELNALARSFLCHSERSEESRIFLGAKHFDFTEAMRSRAAPNSICSYAKLSCQGQAIRGPSAPQTTLGMTQRAKNLHPHLPTARRSAASPVKRTGEVFPPNQF